MCRCSVESWGWKIILLKMDANRNERTQRGKFWILLLEAAVGVTVSTLSSTPAGTTMGLKESECGQMGVIMIAGTLGWIMEAPAATA